MFVLRLAEGAELRPLEPWRAQEFAAHLDRVRPHLAPWIPWATSITDVAGARAWLQDYADRQARDQGRLYGIWLDGVLVGATLFRAFDAESGGCEVGVWIAPEAEGRGLVTRAVRHLIDWAFRERGMHRVEWCNAVSNVRSAAVARRLGMSREGVMREGTLVNGVRHDIEVWSVLASEWRTG